MKEQINLLKSNQINQTALLSLKVLTLNRFLSQVWIIVKKVLLSFKISHPISQFVFKKLNKT
jgi:hypothetical protein